MKQRNLAIAICASALFAAAGLHAAPDHRGTGDWMEKVPATEHALKSPIRNKAAATEEGRGVFQSHCALCHGEGAKGTHLAPPLISDRVQKATDGDVHWLLVNGNKAHGMPAWSKLGDHQLWELVAYVKSLH